MTSGTYLSIFTSVAVVVWIALTFVIVYVQSRLARSKAARIIDVQPDDVPEQLRLHADILSAHLDHMIDRDMSRERTIRPEELTRERHLREDIATLRHHADLLEQEDITPNTAVQANNTIHDRRVSSKSFCNFGTLRPVNPHKLPVTNKE